MMIAKRLHPAQLKLQQYAMMRELQNEWLKGIAGLRIDFCWHWLQLGTFAARWKGPAWLIIDCSLSACWNVVGACLGDFGGELMKSVAQCKACLMHGSDVQVLSDDNVPNGLILYFLEAEGCK